VLTGHRCGCDPMELEQQCHMWTCGTCGHVPLLVKLSFFSHSLFTSDTKINYATPKPVVSMADNEHETYHEMSQRIDAWLAAAGASAFRAYNNLDESDKNDEILANIEAAEAAEAEKKEKKETPTEIWKRILNHKEAKSVKSIKTAAKKSTFLKSNCKKQNKLITL
jgi:sulfite reductase alpha subunit-like flavoprotein